MRKRTTGNYSVGKGRPPVETRFRKGESGNIHGRPKGSKSASTLAKAELNRKITVTLNGKKRKLTVAEVASRRLGDKAMSGDPKAFMLLVGLANVDHGMSKDTKDFITTPERDDEILREWATRNRVDK